MKLNFFLLLILLVIKPVQAFMLPQTSTLKAYNCSSCTSLPQERLSLNWPINSDKLGHETLHQQASRKYLLSVSLKELHEGVAIYTQAPGAIIRISPFDPKETLIPELRIQSPTGTIQSLHEASRLFSKDLGLQGTVFSEKTLVLAALKPELNAGKFIVSSPSKQVLKGEDKRLFVISVFDANSPIELFIKTDKAAYQSGEELKARISLNKGQIDSLKVLVISPEGQKIPLIPEMISPNVAQVKFPLLSEKNSQGENWELEATASGSFKEQVVYRLAHTSFSYAIPSAAVREITKTSAGSFDFSAKIDVATDSRYLLQAVLFASDAQGKLHPFQTVQTSTWLVSGFNDLLFSFDSHLKTNYQAPYYLGYIHLLDYGQYKPVYQYDSLIALDKLA